MAGNRHIGIVAISGGIDSSKQSYYTFIIGVLLGENSILFDFNGPEKE